MMISFLADFRRQERGAVVVEFSLVVPFMLLVFGLSVEAARMLWSYQIAIEGVREATRYVARWAPREICQTGGSLAGYSATLAKLIEEDLSGNTLFPPKVTVNSVTATLKCVAGDYRVDPLPVATVTANISMEFPLASVMQLFGQSMTSLTTDVADSQRVIGS